MPDYLRTRTNKKIILGDLVLFFCLFLNFAYADTLNCGKAVVGEISVQGEKDSYTFSASANDPVTIRCVKYCDDFWFNLYLELYGPDGKFIASALGKIDSILPLTGIYTLIVRDDNNLNRGKYSLVFQKLNNPCLTKTLQCGQPFSDAFNYNSNISLNFYTFNASANDAVFIRCVKDNGSSLFLNPCMELYSPDGRCIATTPTDSSITQIYTLLPLTGIYTLIVREEHRWHMGEYSLVFQKLNNPCSATALQYNRPLNDTLANNVVGVNFYTFSASANDSVTFHCKRKDTSDNFKPYLELYGPHGEEIVKVGFFSPGIQYPMVLEGKINQVMPQTGKYTFIIRDDDNLGSGSYTLTLFRQNLSPTVGSIMPSSGLGQNDVPTIFTTTYSDPDPAGWQDIKLAYLLINTSTAGANCFWGYYDQNANKLYLRNDANTGWLGGFTPGSSYVIENSYAKLDCSQTTVSGSGKTLTINWSIVFKFAFGGKTYNTYLYVKDDFDANSGWVQKGTWKVDAIKISSFLPVDKSRYIEGMVINCSVQAVPANSQYQYQFLIDGQIKRPFGTNNTWNWQTTSSHIGIRTLTIQIKNRYGSKVESSRRLMIYRRPIEPQ